MPREIPFPNYSAGDRILASDLSRMAETTNNLTSQATGFGIHSIKSTAGTFHAQENPRPFIYAKIIKKVEVTESPLSGSGSGSGSGANNCPDNSSGLSGTSGSGSGCVPTSTIIHKYSWRQMFEQDGILYDPIGDDTFQSPVMAGSADRIDEPQYYWPAYELNNRDVDIDTIVQLYFGWGPWLYFNLGGFGVGGPAYIDVITNICPIYEEVEPSIGLTRLDTANGIKGGPITAQGTIELENTISSSGTTLSGISQGSEFKTSDNSLRLWVNNQGRITQILSTANQPPPKTDLFSEAMTFEVPELASQKSLSLMTINPGCWETFEVRSEHFATTLEIRCLDTINFGALSLKSFCSSHESNSLFEVRLDEATQTLDLCYRPISFSAHTLRIKAKHFLDEAGFNRTLPEKTGNLLGFVSALKPDLSWRIT